MNPEPPIPAEPPPVVSLPLLPAPAISPAPPRPWGFWLTVVFGIVIFVAYVVPQMAVAMVAVLLDGGIHNPHGLEASVMNGLVVGIGICLATPVAVGLCVLFAWLRRSLKVMEYLGLLRVSWKMYATGVGAIILFNLLFATLSVLLGRPDASETMLEIYRTAGFAPILWVAMVIGAPVMEEVFFRGFLFKGFEHSPVGSAGAVVLTSLGWAAIHVQYDLYDMGVIFSMGLLLGVFRWKTGSLLPGLLMHVLNNLAATVQVVLLIQEENLLSALL